MMFEHLDDPNPPRAGDTELAHVRSRARELRRSRRRAVTTVGSSGVAVVAVVAAVGAAAALTSGNGAGAGRQSALADASVTAPASPSSLPPSTPGLTASCLAEFQKLRPAYIPAGLKLSYASSGSPGEKLKGLGRTWSNAPVRSGKVTLLLNVDVTCPWKAQYGQGLTHPNQTATGVTVHGNPAVLFHDHNAGDSAVSIAWNLPNGDRIVVGSDKLNNGIPDPRQLSDAEILKVADSLPVLAQ